MESMAEKSWCDFGDYVRHRKELGLYHIISMMGDFKANFDYFEQGNILEIFNLPNAFVSLFEGQKVRFGYTLYYHI